MGKAYLLLALGKNLTSVFYQCLKNMCKHATFGVKIVNEI